MSAVVVVVVVVVTPLVFYKAFLAKWFWGKVDTIHRPCLLLLSLPLWRIYYRAFLAKWLLVNRVNFTLEPLCQKGPAIHQRGNNNDNINHNDKARR